MNPLRVLASAVAAGAVLLAFAPLAVASPPPSPPLSAQPSPPQAPDPAVQAFGGCLKGSKAGSLLLLVDESASLRSSDPGTPPARVVAAKYLLRQLQRSGERAGITIDVAVAAFASDYTQVHGWTPLDRGSLDGVVAAVDGLATRDTGIETDYVQALDGARNSLAEHATAAPAAGACRAVAWFTDGQLDIVPRLDDEQRATYGTTKPYADGVDLSTEAGAEAAQAAAYEEICRDGGLADQLRSREVTTFAVGLSDPKSPPDFDVLRTIATGAPAGGKSCGTITRPPPGTFKPATDIDELLFAFDEIVDPDTSTTTEICGPVIVTCTARHQFVLDDTIEGVHILGSSDRAGLQARLIGPSGTEYDLATTKVAESQTLDAGGVTVTHSWQSDRTLTVDLDRPTPAAPWTGVWALVFVDPSQSAPSGTSRSNIHIWGDLQPAWLGRPTGPLNSGEVLPDVRLGVARTDGSPYQAASAPGSLSLSAVLIARDGTETEILDGVDKSRIGAPVELDLRGVEPGTATLRLVLNVTTAPAVPPGGTAPVPGTPLAPEQVDIPLDVATPVGYPTFAAEVDFGTLEGQTETTTALTVTGPGCVWVPADPGPSFSTRPAGAGAVTIGTPSATSPATCLAVAEGATVQLPLRLAVEGVANGTLTGTLSVSVSPPGAPDRARSVPVDVTANLVKPRDEPTFWLVLLLTALLGPGLPLGLLYLFKWLGAKIPDRGLHAVRIPVTVVLDEVRRDGARFVLRPEDTVRLVPIPPGGARRVEGIALDVPGMTLTTRVGGSPFGAGYTEVGSPPYFVVSSTRATPYGDGSTTQLPLAVHDNYVVRHDPNGPEDVAEVVVLISAGSSSAHLETLAQRVRDGVPGRIAAMRAYAARRGAGRPDLVLAVPAPTTDLYTPGHGAGPVGPPIPGYEDRTGPVGPPPPPPPPPTPPYP